MNFTNRHKWLASPLGEYLLANEQPFYDDIVTDIFGFNAVQIGFYEVNLLINSRIPTQLHTEEIMSSNDAVTKVDVHCDGDALPFAPESLDLVLLPHVLEFSANPHQALREVERVLMVEGYVIISGFNPYSSWGLNRFLRNRYKKNKPENNDLAYPWCGQFFSQTRIKDWLALLGLELVSTHNTCYNFPSNHNKWLVRFKILDKIGRKCWPKLGGIYYIVAKKRVASMTLLKPNWKKSPIKVRLATSVSQKDTHQHSHKMINKKTHSQ